MRSIVTSLNRLQRDEGANLNPSHVNDIETAVASAKHLYELVRDLLAYSEIGKRNDTLQTTNCNAVFDVAMTQLKGLVEEHGALITRGSLPCVNAVPMEIEQIFQNLITNAIKYRSDRPPLLHMDADEKEGFWYFYARDNGVGVRAEHCEKIFDSFQRAPTEYPQSGTGLGLSICKRVVESHGGRIWMESDVGKGSTIYFTLPVKK